MPLWDDATAGYRDVQPLQNDRSLWGWLTNLFSPNRTSQFANIGGGMNLPRNAAGEIPGTAIQAALGSPTGGGWAGTGAPASMQVAPPSMFTTADPQQQGRWQQASNPTGYATLASAPGVGTAPVAAPATAPSVFRPPPAAMMPPPPKPMPPLWQQAPVITGPSNPPPGNYSAPAGGSKGWPGTMGILPPGYGPTGPPPMPSAPVTSSPAVVSPPVAANPPRTLSDADIQNMSYGDVLNFVGRSDLTYAQRMALTRRLNEMSPGAVTIGR